MDDETRAWKCGKCGHAWDERASDDHGACPTCQSKDIWTRQPLGAILSFEGALEPRLIRVLDALRLTVLGLLLTVGLTVGLGIGFGVGGCTGAVAGTLGGLFVPFALAYAFRNQRTRNWLAHLADCVLAPDNKDHRSRPT